MNEKSEVAILVQRLVDSDLSPRERNELLNRAGNENLWRSIALAFMEAQSLDQTFGDLKVSEDVEEAARLFPRRKLAFSNGVSVLWRYGCIAATAATLLLMLYSGSLLNQTTTEQTQTIAHAENSHDDRAIDLEEALARSGAPVPERFKLDLLHAGYLLSESNQVADVNLPFGGTVQMPVRKFDIRYLGQAAFQ